MSYEPIPFPKEWKTDYARLPEYKIISKLVSRAPYASRRAVIKAADEIEQITKVVIKTVRLPTKKVDEYHQIINYDISFAPKDAISTHVLLVFGSVLNIASLTSHRDESSNNLVDFLIELWNNRDVECPDPAANKFMKDRRSRVWLDTLDTFETMAELEILDDLTYKYESHLEESEAVSMDSRLALLARLSDKLASPYGTANPDAYDADNADLGKLGKDYYSTKWTNTGWEEHIKPVIKYIYYPDTDEDDLSDLGSDVDSLDLADDPVYEPQLRAACIWFIYNSPKLYTMVLEAEDGLRKKGNDPAKVKPLEFGVTSWGNWRKAFEGYLEASRGQEVEEEHVRLSEEAERLLEEAIAAMDKAEREGPEHKNIDWRAALEKKLRARDRDKADYEAKNGEGSWDSGMDDIFDEFWNGEDDESGDEGEEEGIYGSGDERSD